MTLDIEKLRELLEKGTARPWGEGAHGNCNVVHFDGDDVRPIAVAQHGTNAPLICAAVNALPELLAIAEAAFEMVDDEWLGGSTPLPSRVRVLIAAVDAARRGK